MESLDRTRLKELCCAFAPSGCEDEVRTLLSQRLRTFCDRMEADALGNLLCTIEGESERTILLSAHMDEVGMMVTGYTEDGMLTFCCVGGIDTRVLYGRRICVGLPNRHIRGVICAKPLHLQKKDERKKIPDMDELYIDIGATNLEDAKALVDLGDYATFESEYVMLGEHTVKAKALDDRLGCAILEQTLITIAKSKKKPPFTLCFAFTVKEELGRCGSGASAAAYRTKPCLAMVLETTASGDFPNTPPHKQVAILGEGGAVSYIDHGTMYARQVVEFALQFATQHGIALQPKRYLSGANDSAHIHRVGKGTLVLALSAPSRYLHSASCVIDLRDADAMLSFMVSVLQDTTISTLWEEQK